MKKVMGSVEIYDDFITDEQAKSIIKDCEEIGVNDVVTNWNWHDATHGDAHSNGKDTMVRTNDMLHLSSLAFVPTGTEPYRRLQEKKSMHLRDNALSIHQMINQKLIDYVGDYCERYRFNIQFDEGYSILKYSEGQEYKIHTDYSESLPRYLSALILLNPQDYEGGGTYFAHFEEEVKPDKPSLVLFPSNYAYAHQALPVTSGTKYAIVSWLGHVLDLRAMPDMWLPNDLNIDGNI